MPTARGSSGSGTPAPSGSSGQQGGTGKSLDMIIPQSLRARHWAGFTRTMQTEMKAAESARGVSPRAAHRSGLDTLASSGSCHRTKAAASRRELELLLVASWLTPNVGDLPPSLHGHYPASSLLRSSPPLSAASVLSASQFRCLYPFPLASPDRFSSSVREPERESCLLYTGHRVASR